MRLARRILIVASLLAVTVLIASAIASPARGVSASAKDASAAAVAADIEKPKAPLPSKLVGKDTTPPATVQNLRRIDTADEKSLLASCDPKSR